MARAINREKLLKRIPAEFHKYLKEEADFSFVNSLFKLDRVLLGHLSTAVDSKYKAIVQYLLADKTPKAAVGKKSALPYTKEHIALAGALMRKKAGETVKVGDEEVELVTVQVQIKVKVGGKTKSVALSKMAAE